MPRMRPVRRTSSSRPVVRALWLLAACLSLGLGMLGIVVIGLPTVPFILLASFCAARGSRCLHVWLRRHRHFGPMIADWEESGVVRRQAKWMASLMMALCSLLMLALVSRKIWLVATLCMALVASWLWFRPEPDGLSASKVDEAG